MRDWKSPLPKWRCIQPLTRYVQHVPEVYNLGINLHRECYYFLLIVLHPQESALRATIASSRHWRRIRRIRRIRSRAATGCRLLPQRLHQRPRTLSAMMRFLRQTRLYAQATQACAEYSSLKRTEYRAALKIQRLHVRMRVIDEIQRSRMEAVRSVPLPPSTPALLTVQTL